MRKRARPSGFTIIELLVVMALVVVVTVLGVPALLRMLERAKLQESARETSVMMQIARAEAIKRGTRAGITVSYATNEVIGFVDVDFDTNPGFTAGDREMGRLSLPKGVSLYGPGDAEGGPRAGANWGSVGEGKGFVENAALEGTAFFRTDGGVEREGAFRMRDTRSNYLEIRVAPAATARIALQKFRSGNPADPSSWEGSGEGAGWVWN